MRDTTKCSKDHIINEETNPFWILPLSLKDTSDTTYSVESSFKRTFQTKTYTGDNMVYCNDCKKDIEATSRCEMVEAPQILILLLKRFDFDHNTWSHFKSDCCVEVPCELQLEDKTYKLYGMVNHMGSISGGHYTATVLSEDNTWCECNDSHVSEVRHQLFAEDRTLRSGTVYLLTYRAAESQKSPETNKMNNLRQDDLEPKRSSIEKDVDGGNKGQTRQKDTDEVQETSDEAVNTQTGGESDEVQKSEGVKASVNGEGRDDRNANISRWRRLLHILCNLCRYCLSFICSNSVETNSDDQAKETKEGQHEYIDLEPKGDHVECKGKTDDQ